MQFCARPLPLTLLLCCCAFPLHAQTTQDAVLTQEPPDVGIPSEAEVDALLRSDPATGAQSPDSGDIAYSVSTSTLDSIGLSGDFGAYSVLLRDAGRSAPSLAELNRRVRVDSEVIGKLLRAAGYYDALVDPQLNRRASGGYDVSFDIDPGPIYRFSSVTPPDLGIAVGDPVNASAVQAAVAAYAGTLATNGFAFAEVPEAEVTVDHETARAQLVLDVAPGPRGAFGRIILENEDAPFNAEHIASLARFSPGDRYDPEDVEDLRRALIATGLVGSISIQPTPAGYASGTDPGSGASARGPDEVEGGNTASVDLVMTVEPAPPRTLAAQLAYDTVDGVRVEGSWQHRNLFPPEGAFTASLIAGEQQVLASAALRRSNFRRRDQAVGGRLAFFREDRDAFYNRGVSVSAYLERETNIIWQKRWTYRFGPEFLFTQERDRSADQPVLRDYVIGAFPARLSYDGTDDLLDPTESFRLTGFVSPEISMRGRAFAYTRAEVAASTYIPVDAARTAIIALRGSAGSIIGAGRENIAPSRRFYAGGGGSVRGYGFQDVGPIDDDGDPRGGRSKVEGSVEGRYRFGDLGAAIFLDAGQVYTATTPSFGDLRYGAGVGIRYYTSFGPIRADIATPLNPRPGDPTVAVYVSIGQAF